MKYTIVIALLLNFSGAFCQNKQIRKEIWHWQNNKIKQGTIAGYCQVLKIDNIHYISGAVTENITPEGIISVYKELKASLASFGATFENVVKENLYTTDIDEMKKLNYVRKQFYDNDFPAATWVQIQRLYMSKAKLESIMLADLNKESAVVLFANTSLTEKEEDICFDIYNLLYINGVKLKNWIIPYYEPL